MVGNKYKFAEFVSYDNMTHYEPEANDCRIGKSTFDSALHSVLIGKGKESYYFIG